MKLHRLSNRLHSTLKNLIIKSLHYYFIYSIFSKKINKVQIGHFLNENLTKINLILILQTLAGLIFSEEVAPNRGRIGKSEEGLRGFVHSDFS